MSEDHGSDDTVALGAVCAVHDAAAIRTCARCGNNVCERCLDHEALRDDLCEACRERVGGGAPLPWETADGSWWRRWLVTARGLVLAPVRTIEGAAAGDWRRALTFAALVGGAQAIAPLGVVLYRGWSSYVRPPRPGVALGVAVVWLSLLLGAALAQIGWAALRGLAFHLAARLSGSRRGWRVSLWSAGYAHGAYLLTAGLFALELVPAPVRGLLVLLLLLGVEALVAIGLVAAARVHHRLPFGRAAFAGWAPFLALLVLGAGCIFGGSWLLLELALLPD